MKKHLIMLAAILTLAVGCDENGPKVAEQPTPQRPAVDETAAGGFTGTALASIKAQRYTYVQVDTGTEKIWAATPEFRAKVGDTVVVPKGLAMENFHSKTLNRDFEVVYFVSSIAVRGNEAGFNQQAKMGLVHPAVDDKGGKSKVEIGSLKRVEGGKTVAEIFAGKNDLAGKQVSVRGKVVKFLPEIMGKNWLHLQDGSGNEGTNDLTVTTGARVNVGDVVLASGVVAVDRDFGFGYEYEVILEDAQVSVE